MYRQDSHFNVLQNKLLFFWNSMTRKVI
jgi:hypothetical protein